MSLLEPTVYRMAINMENNKIIVVGAGHGGLVAAAVLAKNGYNVTVYERNTKKQLGYDWRDCASLKVIREVGIDSLSESDFQIMPRTSFYLASCISPIVQSQENAKTNSTTVERRALLSALVDHAKECGAKIKFGVSVTEPIIDGDRVSGVVTDKGEVLCDLVIDAAGVDSPIRTALPEDFGIELNHAPGEVLYAYRGYFNKEEKYPETRSPYEVFIYQMGKKGLSWCVTEEDRKSVV